MVCRGMSVLFATAGILGAIMQHLVFAVTALGIAAILVSLSCTLWGPSHVCSMPCEQSWHGSCCAAKELAKSPASGTLAVQLLLNS